jgi:hypothetical protein
MRYAAASLSEQERPMRQQQLFRGLWGGCAALALALFSAPASAQAQVGVSIEFGKPGMHGRVDIGNMPPPQVIVQQPVIIRQPPPPRVVVAQPVPVVVEPVYMWVPPKHRRNWSRYCDRYRACGVPVYFVQDRWYDENVRRGRGRDDEHRGRGRRGGDDDDHRGRGKHHGSGDR